MTAPKPTLFVPDAVAAVVRSLHPLMKKKVRRSLEDILADPGAERALGLRLILFELRINT